MERNVIVTGASGGLGTAVVDAFKREGYRIIATVLPGSGDHVEAADDVYEVNLADEDAVLEFFKEIQMQYGDVDALILLVGGFAMGDIETTSANDIKQMVELNFFSAYHMVRAFLPGMKKADHGQFLLVGAKPAAEKKHRKSILAYALSKGMLMDFAQVLGEECEGTKLRTHVFVPSIIDTPANRAAMPDADFAAWVNPEEIAEAMHYALNNPSLKDMTFKLYGDS